MLRNIHRIGQSLVLRLLVPVAVVILVAVSLHIILLSSQEELFERKLRDSERVGSLVEAMMLYDMRRNQLHDFQTYLNMLPFGDDLAAIRMYDAQGVMHYAVGDSITGRKVDRMNDPTCAACHRQPSGMPIKRRNLRRSADGRYLFQADFPLKNGEACYECHDSSQPYLGNLLTELTFSPIELRLLNRRKMMILVGSLVMLGAIAAIWLFLQFQIVRPIKRLVQVIEKSKQGMITERIDLRRRDEIGYLVSAYNEMMDRQVDLQNRLQTQVKDRTKELESSRIQLLLRENLASLGRLAAGIAHELGNPLTGISSIVQLVKRRKRDDAFVVEQLDLVHGEIDRLTRLTRQMVDLARPEDPRKTVFDIKSSINKAFQIARLDRRLQKRIVKVPDDDEPLRVEANEDAVIQIIMNLLFNAADFTADEGIISIHAAVGSNGRVEVRVVDNGSGIPQEEQQRIFDPFYTGKRSRGGTGLGLSVSHSLARSFGGALVLESSDPSGTTFLLKLPSRS